MTETVPQDGWSSGDPLDTLRYALHYAVSVSFNHRTITACELPPPI